MFVTGLDGYVWFIDEWGRKQFGMFDIIIGVSKLCNLTRLHVDDGLNNITRVTDDGGLNIYTTNKVCFDLNGGNMPGECPYAQTNRHIYVSFASMNFI